MMKFNIQWLFSLFLMSSSSDVLAERYTIDLTNEKMNFASATTLSSTRLLQTQATTENPCYISNDKIVCTYMFAPGPIGNETTINFLAQCDIPETAQYSFDYRRASNCACIAQVTPKNGSMKECPCTVCGADLGETPVSVDCSMYGTDSNTTGNMTNVGTAVASVEQSTTNNSTTTSTSIETLVDPFLFLSCTSIDCFGTCNGTCSLNCNDPSGNVCPFCETYSGPGAPTSSPTGSGKNDIVNLGETSRASNVVSNAFTAGFVMVTVTILSKTLNC
jgi:hypothetical protein